MSGAGIEIRDLAKRYTPRRSVIVEAIRHLDLSVAPGEFVAIVGPPVAARVRFFIWSQALSRLPAAAYASVTPCPKKL